MPVPDGALTEYEIENVSREVKDHVELLAEEMEMEYSLEEAKSSRRPTQDFAYSLIADFAESKDGTRNKLVQFLRSANFPDTARRLEKCNIIADHFLYHFSCMFTDFSKERCSHQQCLRYNMLLYFIF